MKLHEFQAKEIFRKYGMLTPESCLATNVKEAIEAVDKLGASMLKAQVLVGGRGKAGGIKKVVKIEETREKAQELFDTSIRGHKVRRLLVEKSLDIEQEMYLSFILDKKANKPTLLFSPIGGINIEDIARDYPESLFKIAYDPIYGLQDFQLRKLLFKTGLDDETLKELSRWLKKLDQIAWAHEAELVEINPLVKAEGKLYAVDAVVIIDDNSLFRQNELEKMKDPTEMDVLERDAHIKGLNYVRLEGDIGVIANGAGLAMTTMDMIAEMGGNPANFLDTGGGLAEPDKMKKCLLHVLSDSNVKVVYINIYAEITRCEKVAEGIALALDEFSKKTFLIIKLTGVNENEGKEFLRDYLSNTEKKAIFVDSLEEGAEKAVQYAGGGGTTWQY